MERRRRFLNPAQPQTLQIAIFLLYLDAFFRILYVASNRGGRALGVALIVAGVAAAFGIANERKWGYGLGVAMAFVPFVYRFYYFSNPLGADLLTLMFEIALVALLLHPQSRDYQRIWFK